MSASNWAICPVCKAKRTAHFIQREQAVAALYGEVPVDEFDEARAELEAEKAKPVEATFREDYEIYGAATGTVTVSYGGGCDECGTNLTFRHEHQIEATA